MATSRPWNPRWWVPGMLIGLSIMVCELAPLDLLAAHEHGAEVDSVERLFAEGRYIEAEAEARSLVVARERSSDLDSLPVADALDVLVEALRRNGKAGEPEARASANRALRIKMASVGPKSASYARSLTALGSVLVTTAHYAEAKQRLEQAGEIMNAVASGPDSLDLAEILDWQAVLEIRTGHPAEAAPLLERALWIRRSQLPPEHHLIAESLNALAATRYQMGEFVEAAPLYEEALAILLRTSGPDHAQVGSCRHNLGVLYAELGDQDEARRQLQEALRVRRSKLSPGHPLLGSTLAVLAETDDAVGATKSARQHFTEAITIYERAYGDSSDRTAWVRMRQGLFLLKQGDSTAAGQSLRRALEAQEHSLGPDHHDLGFTLVGLADIAAGRGDLEGAGRGYRRAASIQTKGLGADHPDLVLTLGHLARFQVESGDIDGGIETALEAIRVQEQHVRLTAGGSAERQALAWASSRPLAMDAALSALTRGDTDVSSEVVPSVWDALVRTRTVVLDEVAHRNRLIAEARGDSSFMNAVDQLHRARSRLARTIVQGDPSAVRDARLHMEQAERHVASRSKPYRDEIAESRAGLRDVLDSLPSRTGLVAFARFGTKEEGGYLAFVARGDRKPTRVFLGSARALQEAIRRWAAGFRQTIPERGAAATRVESAHRAAGNDLSRLLWAPVEPYLRGVERCFVVPEGEIFRVSFAALPTSGGYLIETGPRFHYLSSERDLASGWRTGQPGRGLLAMGGPAFDGETDRSATRRSTRRSATGGSAGDCRDLTTIRFEPLPESRQEVAEVAALWPDSGSVTVLTGTQATEGALKRLAPGRRTIHLATHGFFLDEGCSGSSGKRGIGGTTSDANQNVTQKPSKRRGALLRAGLAFAGANRSSGRSQSTDDGILTAEEVASMDLTAVDWAVLSACDTGLGDLQTGEGVLGLRRAFQSAGVHTLVMSLWSVEDRATRSWMHRLYEGRASKGLPTEEAVAEATRGVLRERRAQALSTHPFYWAAFVAVGDWR